ncbi:sensor histidine kinase [Tsukamurella paurometabola]|uniref:histidine kinase n=1 Tax=Tsukamurella paurometabola (strain ATCC 8368 / DSM 20162 / CCUG 35730 / CIP 100753 / JCM 10117 / KCTC 9821 / NBRC 16120 / NCIMB 702349 / NCTC 13040) TaxID=521096 RepID=D5UXT7_TSUPD|nr:sensor histidine kinase [Tsukamurella paurometabola]ADG80174.1 signal transduction histidine kinase regulating citrate/malate metabolism [Tsukamurella paurometabola DSM 20162]
MDSRRSPSLATQVFLAQVALLITVAVLVTALVVWDDRGERDRAAQQQTTAVAVSVATSPETARAIASPDPTAALQERTSALARRLGVDFIVVMAPDRTRYTHADPERIGQPFSGNIDRALAGETFTETYTGTLGPSIRAVTPVYDDGGRLVGLVSAGVTRARLGDQLAATLPGVLLVSALALAFAIAASWLIERRVRRQTLGLAPAALRELYEHHDAVLHTLTEGVIVFDDSAPAGPAAVVNDEARRLLGLPNGAVHATDLPESLRGDGGLTDELHVTGDRVLLVNRHPVTGPTGRVGVVTTLRDRTELQGVLGELDSVRAFAEALSAQAHENANRLHAVVTMIELGRGDDAVEVATADLAASQGLIDRLATAAEPAVTALLVGKIADAAAAGVELTVAEGAELGGGPLDASEMLTVLGNLIDNAVDAAGPEGWVEISGGPDETGWALAVADSGAGMDPAEFERARTRGYSTKDASGRVHGRGLGLALVDRLVRRYGGSITATRNPATVEVHLPPGSTR